jgi:O-acetyl-ADP-ribose deacetylase (regulator of RNase III)
LAKDNELASIAFPSISTGVYGYPIDKAARIALSTVRSWLREHPLPERAVFCCFSSSDVEIYEQLANEA